MKTDDKQSPKAKAGALALGEVQKSIRFFRLYPHDHPLCAKSIEEAQGAIARCLERFGPLEAEIQREGVAVEGTIVLRDSQQSTDLSALLFPEGISQLTLEPGIPTAEVRDLIEILSANYAEKENELVFTNDLLTALWKRDFGHVEYKLHDQLSWSAVQSEQLDDDAPIAQVIQRIKNVLAELGGLGESAGLEVADFIAALDKGAFEGKLDDKANWATIPERSAEFLGTEDGKARAKVVRELEDPTAKDLLARTADAVVWAALEEDGAPAPEDTARFLAGATLNALSLGQLDKANELLSRTFAADADEKVIAPAVTARLATQESLTLVTKALSKEASSLANGPLAGETVRFLTRLDTAALDSVCKIYPTVELEGVRRVLEQFLVERVGAGAESIATITLAANEAVVREAARMLAKGGKGSRGWDLLAGAAQDARKELRSRIAREVLDDLSGERERRERLHALETASDKTTRLEALATLVEGGNPRTFDALAKLIDRPDFDQRDEDELKALLEGYTKLGKLRAVKKLQELATRRTLLFRRAEIRRVAGIAQACLDTLKKKGSP